MATYYKSVDPNSNLGKWMLRIFIIIGVIALIGALISLVMLVKERGDYEKTDGTIVGFNSEGNPVVEYTVDGQTHRMLSNVSSSSYYEGKTLPVLYKTAAPENAKAADGYYVMPIVLGGLGVCFTGIPLLIKAFTKKAKEQEEE